MFNLIRKGALKLFIATAVIGLASCGGHDHDYVTPPGVKVTHAISGRVTNISGDGIQATVSMSGKSMPTNVDGTFVFEEVAVGKHTLKAEATGKIAAEEEIIVTEGGSNDNPVWSVALSNVGVPAAAKADGSVEAAVASETVKGNDNAKVEVEVTAPAGAIPAGKTIVITPIYSTKEGEAVTRATETVMLIGANIVCSDKSVTLAKPIDLAYDLDPTITSSITAQKLVNGKWVDASFTVDGGKVVVVADQFTSYALLFRASVTSKTSTEALKFTQDTWDNLFGKKDLSVGAAAYTYKIGAEITASGTDRVTAYLIEILARMMGASVTTAIGNYPINVTLPVGTALEVSGRQTVNTTTVAVSNKSISGKQYGGVTVITRTYNRQHSGGSN